MLSMKFVYQYLLWEFVKSDFKMRYRNSVLGVVWVFMRPLVQFGILYTVFSYLFLTYDPNYKFNLLLGLILFTFFSEGTIRGTHSLLERSNIILKMNFPHHIAVLASVINSFINLIISLGILMLFFIFSGVYPTMWFAVFFLYIVLSFLFVLGFSYFSSIFVIQFRDFGALWEIVIGIVFYLTPIMYPLAILPSEVGSLLVLNPITSVIQDARSILVLGAPPDAGNILYMSFISITAFAIGALYFKFYSKEIAMRL